MAASRRHYAWTVLGLCFLAILCAQGVRLSFGAFVRPWEEAFDASRGTITLIGSLSFLVYGGSQPFVGRAVDRFGIRRTLAASTLLVAAGMALSAAAPGPLALALAYGVVASLGFGGASGVAASVAVTYWFASRRGLAFALVEAGFGAGQLALVPLFLVAVSAIGWREALLAGAVLLALGVAPVLWRRLRDRPEDIGLLPIGGPLPAAVASAVDEAAGRRRAGRGRRPARPAALARLLVPRGAVLRVRPDDDRLRRHAPHPARAGPRDRERDRRAARRPGPRARPRRRAAAADVRAAVRPRGERDRDPRVVDFAVVAPTSSTNDAPRVRYIAASRRRFVDAVGERAGPSGSPRAT
jgi:hypothetical protein